MVRRLPLLTLVLVLLATCAAARAAAPSSDVFVLPDGRRHVILDGAPPAMVGGLFPGEDVAVETRTLTAVPWRPVDAVAFGPTRVATAETLVADLLARGATVLVASDARPAGPWPWQRVTNGWMARYDVAGPSRFAAPGVYASADLRPVGRPTDQRRNVVLLATLYALGTLGLALLVGQRRHAILAIAGLSALASGGLIVWGNRQDRVHATGVTVVVQTGDLRQVDRWTFERVPEPTARVVDPAATGWPVFRSPTHRAQSQLALLDGGRVSYRLDRGAPMALLHRTVTTGLSPAMTPTPLPLRWRSLTSQYTAQDVTVLGMTTGGTDDAGPTIWLHRDAAPD